MSPHISFKRFRARTYFLWIAVFDTQQGIAQQPMLVGELNVDVVGTGSSRVQINVYADLVYGSRSGWYQGYWAGILARHTKAFRGNTLTEAVM